MSLTKEAVCSTNLTELTDAQFDIRQSGICEATTTSPSVVVTTPRAMVVYLAIIAVLGVLLNQLVSLTILRRHRLRTISNAFIISLSVSDFLMASVVVPLRISEHLGAQLNFDITDLLFPTIGVASIFSLCSVTLDRYLHIRNPLNYGKYMNYVRASLLITSIWMFAISHAVVLHYVKRTAIVYEVHIAVSFCLPAIFILAVYTRIALIARSHARVIATTSLTAHNDYWTAFKRDIKVLKNVALVVGTFFVCWLPFLTLTNYSVHRELEYGQYSSTLTVFLHISECLVCSGPVFNPLIYGFLRRDLRTAIKYSIACRKERSDDITTG